MVGNGSYTSEFASSGVCAPARSTSVSVKPDFTSRTGPYWFWAFTRGFLRLQDVRARMLPFAARRAGATAEVSLRCTCDADAPVGTPARDRGGGLRGGTRPAGRGRE